MEGSHQLIAFLTIKNVGTYCTKRLMERIGTNGSAIGAIGNHKGCVGNVKMSSKIVINLTTFPVIVLSTRVT